MQWYCLVQGKGWSGTGWPILFVFEDDEEDYYRATGTPRQDFSSDARFCGHFDRACTSGIIVKGNNLNYMTNWRDDVLQPCFNKLKSHLLRGGDICIRTPTEQQADQNGLTAWNGKKFVQNVHHMYCVKDAATNGGLAETLVKLIQDLLIGDLFSNSKYVHLINDEYKALLPRIDNIDENGTNSYPNPQFKVAMEEDGELTPDAGQDDIKDEDEEEETMIDREKSSSAPVITSSSRRIQAVSRDDMDVRMSKKRISRNHNNRFEDNPLDFDDEDHVMQHHTENSAPPQSTSISPNQHQHSQHRQFATSTQTLTKKQVVDKIINAIDKVYDGGQYGNNALLYHSLSACMYSIIYIFSLFFQYKIK